MATARQKKEDYYQILGVSKNSSQDEIKRAFRALAKQKHPDITKNPADAEEFKKISEAYEVLSDPEKRKMYDNFGHDGVNGAGGFSGFNSGGFTDISDLFGDLFSDLFGGGTTHKQSHQSSQRNNRNAPGANYLKNIVISLSDAVLVKKQTININVEVPCDECHHTGAKTPKDNVTCSQCNGKGVQYRTGSSIFGGSYHQEVICSNCQGLGKVVLDKCLKCKGNGYFLDNQKLEFNLPPLIQTGDSLRIKGKGGVSKYNGPQGDLIIRVTVQQDKYFTRRGNDLLIDVPVSYLDILLGNTIVIPTIEGYSVKQQLKSGVQDGSQIIVAQQGSYYGRNNRGKLIATIKVKMPSKITKAEREKLWSINNENGFTPNDDFIKKFNKDQK